MPSTRFPLVVALLALLVASSGCSALQGGDSSQGNEIAQQVQQSMQVVDSYEFEVDMTMSSSQSDRTIDMTASGAVDQANHRMRMDMTVEALGVSTIQYVVEDTLYAKQDGTWVKRNVSRQNVWGNQQLVQQRDLLGNASVSYDGSSTIDGEAVHELSVDVSEEQLKAAIPQQAEDLGSQVSFDDIDYTMYVTQDDHRLERITADTSMTVGGRNMDATLEMTFSNYDGEVSIELPPEARNARSATA